VRRGQRTTPGWLRGILTVGVSLACVLSALEPAPAAADVPEAINVQGALCGAVAGSPMSGTIATVADTDTTVPAASMRAQIDWGDGTVTNGTVTGGAGTFAVAGGHTYASAASLMPVSVIAWNNTTAVSGAVQFWFDVAAAPTGSGERLAAAGGTICGATEGATASGTVATFTDSDHSLVASAFSATIDWGDGSPASIGSVSGSNGVFVVAAAHVYLEESPFDPVQLTVTVSHVGTAVAGAAHVRYLVSEGDVLTGTPVSLDATPGVAFSGTVATFSDQNLHVIVPEFTATIDWGDGSALDTGTVTPGGTPGSIVVSGSHTYAALGTYDVLVEIDDTAPGTASATVDSTANVAERIAVAGSLGGATEGTPVHGVLATFTDPVPGLAAGDFAATIAWGDGTAPSSGTIAGGAGSFTVAATHTYAHEAPSVSAVVSVTRPASGAAGSATMTFPVANADVLIGTPVAIAATAGEAFSGTVARFSDAYTSTPASGLAATIDWGDGTASSAGSVGGSAGAFVVSGTHTYGSEGSFPVTVRLAEIAPGTASATVVGAATVAPDPPPPAPSPSPAPPPAPAPGKNLADVAVRLQGPASVAPGGTMTFTLTVSNAGPAAATNVGAGFAMPWGATLVTASPQAVQCRNALAWPRITLAPGASATYTVQLLAPQWSWGGRLLTLAGAWSRVRDPNPWNNGAAIRSTLTGSGGGHHDHRLGSSG